MSSTRRGLDGLGQLVAKAQDAALQEHRALEEARARLLEAHPRRPTQWRRPLAIGFAAAAVFVVAVIALWPRAPRLTFVVEDRPGEVGRWLAAREAPLDVRFSDGSLISFAPHSGGRVQMAHEHGARILLEHGSANLTIMHLPAASWEVEAGPFRVLVLGTQFGLRWDPAAQQFSLALRRGQVRLEGPVVGTRLVRPGETVQIQVTQRRLQLMQAGTDPKTGTDPKAAPTTGTDLKTAPKTGTDLKTAPKTGTDPRPGKHAQGVDPLRLVKSGRYRAALRAADRRGWPKLLAHAPASTLLALADAARLAGEHARATTIYRTLRLRFPSSEAASIAAFSLGREAFDRRQDYAVSARWFEAYLKEQPTGSLAREALGRLLEARHLGGDRPRAIQTAQRYLRVFPDGPHARLAQTVVQGAP